MNRTLKFWRPQVINFKCKSALQVQNFELQLHLRKLYISYIKQEFEYREWPNLTTFVGVLGLSVFSRPGKNKTFNRILLFNCEAIEWVFVEIFNVRTSREKDWNLRLSAFKSTFYGLFELPRIWWTIKLISSYKLVGRKIAFLSGTTIKEIKFLDAERFEFEFREDSKLEAKFRFFLDHQLSVPVTKLKDCSMYFFLSRKLWSFPWHLPWRCQDCSYRKIWDRKSALCNINSTFCNSWTPNILLEDQNEILFQRKLVFKSTWNKFNSFLFLGKFSILMHWPIECFSFDFLLHLKKRISDWFFQAWS